MLRQTLSALRTPAVEQLLRSSSCVTATTLSRSYHKNVSCTDPSNDAGKQAAAAVYNLLALRMAFVTLTLRLWSDTHACCLYRQYVSLLCCAGGRGGFVLCVPVHLTFDALRESQGICICRWSTTMKSLATSVLLTRTTQMWAQGWSGHLPAETS